MRIQLGSSSSSGSDHEQQQHQQQHGPRASGSGAHAVTSSPIGRESPLANHDESRNGHGLKQQTLSPRQPGKRAVSHLDRISAFRKVSASLGGAASQHALGSISSGPSWMQRRSSSMAGPTDSPEGGQSFKVSGSLGTSASRGAARSPSRRVTFSREIDDDDANLAGRTDSDDDSSSSSMSTSASDECGLDYGRTKTSHGNGTHLRANLRARRDLREASVEAQEVSSRIRLSGEEGMHLQPRQITPHRISGAAGVQHKIPGAAGARSSHLADDFDEIQHLLERMRLQRQNEEKQEREAFEARNEALWESIEKGIRDAERARDATIKAERDRQKAAQEQKEAAENRARQAREAEEKRARDEQQAEEARKREAEAKSATDAQAAQAREAAEAKDKESGGVGNALERQAQQEYGQWASKMAHIKEKVLPSVLANSEWRKQCFSAKRLITRGIGQLTNSRDEIVRITQSIGDVLSQARGASRGGEIYTWILNHLAKCLIRQAEQETAAKQDTAFPLARVVVWLLLDGHAELGDVLMARLNKKCCWCLAFCPPKKAGQDDASYAKQLGKASVDESAQQHTSRMSGIIAMYFAIAQTAPSAPPSGANVDIQRIPAHFRIGALWTWQARAMAPRFLEHALTPALWSVLLEIAGPRLLIAHGRQTAKVWTLLRAEGLQAGKAGFTGVASANSAKVRLQLLLDDWTASGRVENATAGREMDASEP